MKKIPLTGKRGVGSFAIVDDSFAYLAKHRWYLTAFGYVARSVGGRKNHKNQYLHRIVNNTPAGLFTDHVNGNKLDNRQTNLRTADKSLNAINTSLRSDNTSGYKGVSRDKARDAWAVELTYQGRKIHLGRFKDVTTAAKAYNHKARELFGEFAFLNRV